MKYFCDHQIFFVRARYELRVEDKTELELTNVTFTNPVSIDVFNTEAAVTSPTVTVRDCVFPAKVDIVKNGFNPGSFNKLRVENSHVTADGCSLNSTGRVTIARNSLGFVSTGDIEVRGGASLE